MAQARFNLQITLLPPQHLTGSELEQFKLQQQQIQVIYPGVAVSGAGYTIQSFTPAPVKLAQSFKSQQSTRLGIALMVCGTLSSLFNGMGLAFKGNMSRSGVGFWCGVVFILAGLFGVFAAKKRPCMIITFMILAILSSLLAFVLFYFGVVGSHGSSTCRMCHEGVEFLCESCNGGAVAAEALLAVMGGLAMILSIWSYVICGQAVCCCAPPYSETQRNTNQGIALSATQAPSAPQGATSAYPMQGYSAIPQQC